MLPFRRAPSTSRLILSPGLEHNQRQLWKRTQREVRESVLRRVRVPSGPVGQHICATAAGGLQAQYRLGARTGLAPMLFGGVLLVIGLGFAESAGQLFAIIPIGAVGALLIIAGTDLALSRRLFDGRPSCWPVIGVTALLTVVANPAVGLAGGWLAELCRAAIVRTIARRFS